MMEWILSACVLTAAVIGLRYALGGRIDRLSFNLFISSFMEII